MEKPENEPPRTGKLGKLRGREEFSSLQRAHSSGSGTHSNKSLKSRVILPPVTPPTTASIPLPPAVPQKHGRRYPKPFIRGGNQPMSTLDNNHIEQSVERTAKTLPELRFKTSDPDVFSAYEDTSFHRKIRVELRRCKPLAQITINAESRSTDKVRGTFTSSDPMHFVFWHKHQDWKSFYMLKDVAHDFRVLCKHYGVILQACETKQDSKTRVSRPLARAETHCVLCFPEPSGQPLAGQKLFLMLNSEGFRVSGKYHDGGRFYRTFDFKEYTAKISDDWNGQKSATGFLILERKDSRFVCEFDYKDDKTIIGQELIKKGPIKPISKSLAALPSSPTRPPDAKPEPVTPSRKRTRENPIFDAQPTDAFYSGSREPFPTQSSPKTEDDFALSKRAKSTSSPKSMITNNPYQAHVSAALKSELDKPVSEKLESPSVPLSITTKKPEDSGSPTDIAISSTPVVADLNLKPSRRNPRVRRTSQVDMIEPDPIIEPTENDVTQLIEKGFKPLRYTFWDGKSARLNLEDMARLNPQIYLNDNIIWFYLKFYLEKLVANDPASAKKIMMLDTFFYPAMRSIGNGNVPAWVSKQAFNQKPIIFLPIHDSSHWALAMIIGLDETLQQRDKAKDGSHETHHVAKPTVAIFDSLGPSQNTGMMRRITTALSVALKAQGYTPLTYKEYRPLKTDAPNQDNLTDCGVFVLHYVEQILQKLKLFISRVTESQERNIALGTEFWNTEDLEKKRAQLQEELFTLSNSSSNQLSLESNGAAAGEACDESDDFIELVEEENCENKTDLVPQILRDEIVQQKIKSSNDSRVTSPDVAVSDPANQSAAKAFPVEQSSESSESRMNLGANMSDSVSSVSRLSIACSDELA